MEGSALWPPVLVFGLGLLFPVGIQQDGADEFREGSSEMGSVVLGCLHTLRALELLETLASANLFLSRWLWFSPVLWKFTVSEKSCPRGSTGSLTTEEDLPNLWEQKETVWKWVPSPIPAFLSTNWKFSSDFFCSQYLRFQKIDSHSSPPPVYHVHLPAWALNLWIPWYCLGKSKIIFISVVFGLYLPHLHGEYIWRCRV